MSDLVMRIPTKRPDDPACFDAWDRPDLGGTLVDLRLFPAGYNGSSRDALIYRPEVLERDGINPAIIEAAKLSSPPGFLLRKEDGWYAVQVLAFAPRKEG
jgi:hypothetical protein